MYHCLMLRCTYHKMYTVYKVSVSYRKFIHQKRIHNSINQSNKHDSTTTNEHNINSNKATRNCNRPTFQQRTKNSQRTGLIQPNSMLSHMLD